MAPKSAPSRPKSTWSTSRAVRATWLRPVPATETHWFRIDTIANLVAIAAGVVIPFYALGVVLMAHFVGEYGIGLAEAWYAVGLVPRMGVVGHALYATALGAVFVLATAAVHLFQGESSDDQETPTAESRMNGESQPREPDGRLAALIRHVGNMLREAWDQYRPPFIEREVLRRVWLQYGPSFLAIWIVGVLFYFGTDWRKWIVGTVYIVVTVVAVVEARRLLERSGRSVWTVLAAIGMLYLPAYGAAIIRAWDDEPRLPDVRLVESVAGSDEVSGKLLAHADGYWYVFDERERVVVAIADSRVVQATLDMSVEHAATPTTAP